MEVNLPGHGVEEQRGLVVGDIPWTFKMVVNTILQNVPSEILSIKLMDLAIRLQVPPENLLLLKKLLSHGNITHVQALYRILEDWRAKFSRMATLHVLVRTFEKSDLLDCADALRKQMTEVERAQSFLLVSTDEIVESTKWGDLSLSLKSEMLSKTVLFQGTSVFLHEISEVLQFADGRLFVLLANNDIPSIVNNNVITPELYMERKVSKKIRLADDVFKIGIGRKDILAIMGISSKRLSTLVAEESPTGTIIVKQIEDFDKLCINADESTSVHLIRSTNLGLEWIKSCGPVSTIKKYLAKTQDSYDELQLIFNNEKVVVISDYPGTGKTSLLNNLAMKAITMFGDRMLFLVRFFTFPKFLQTFIRKEINIDFIVSTIAKLSSDLECGQKVVSLLLKTETCMLMFDGFDELLPNQIPVAIQILQQISKLPFVRIYVTTRPEMHEELENALHTFCYRIKPFEETDQLNFLYKYWALRGVKITKAVKKFGIKCIKQLNEAIISDSERRVTGIPMQCRILADLYVAEAELCAAQRAPSITPLSSLFDLYERYIFKILNLDVANFDAQKPNLTDSDSQVRRSINSAIKRTLMNFAIDLLHPEFCDLFTSFQKSIETIPYQQLSQVALLEPTKSGNVQFVHRSFAEYFFAWFVIENFNEKTTKKPFLSEVFSTTSDKEVLETPFGSATYAINCFRFKQPSIPYFIHSMFRNLPRENESSKLMPTSSIWSDHNFTHIAPIFSASAFHNFTHLPPFLALHYNVEDTNTPEFETNTLVDLMLTTAKHSDVELMKFFISQLDIGSMKICRKFYPITPLHAAARWGNFKMVEYLVNHKYDAQSVNLQFLLHFCTFETANDNLSTLEDKKQIIDLLIAKNRRWAEEKQQDGTTSILQPRVHSKLIEAMIELGVDINVLNENENTLLHMVVENPIINAETYHRIVVALRQRGFMYFNKANRIQRRTPLHCAVEKIDLTEHTIKILESEGADFNAVDNEGNSVLFTAIYGGRSKEFISMLDKLGANEMVQQVGTEKMLRLDGTNIRYTPDYELGHGATSTVYMGYYGTAPAAIKKLKSEFVDFYYRELNVWRDMRKTIEMANLNIISLYDFVKWETKHGTAYYFAMELAVCDLEKRVEQLKKLAKTADPQLLAEKEKLPGFIHGAANGLQWMANLNILHRDIKPANVMIFATSSGGEIAKLGDFGISRKISGMSTGTDSAGRGTSDWMAPEAIRAMNRGEEYKFPSTKAIDIFSLGMTAHFTISLGEHPFAVSKKYRNIKVMNIIENKILPSKLGPPNYLADHLFQWMMQKSVKDRPKILEVVDHPYFWDCEKSVDFLVEVAARLDQKSDATVSRIRSCIDNHYLKNGQHPDWKPVMSSSTRTALFYGNKTYDTPKNSIMKLVELIRDKFMHRQEMIQHDNDGVFTDGSIFSKRKYAEYFQTTFPDVIIHIFCVLAKETPATLGELKIPFFKGFGTNSSIKLPIKT